MKRHIQYDHALSVVLPATIINGNVVKCEMVLFYGGQAKTDKLNLIRIANFVPLVFLTGALIYS